MRVRMSECTYVRCVSMADPRPPPYSLSVSVTMGIKTMWKSRRRIRLLFHRHVARTAEMGESRCSIQYCSAASAFDSCPDTDGGQAHVDALCEVAFLSYSSSCSFSNMILDFNLRFAPR